MTLTVTILTRTALSCLLVIAACLPVVSQQDSAGQAKPQAAEFQAILKRINEGSSDSVLAAGASGNREFVPYLRRKLNDKKYIRVKLSNGKFVPDEEMVRALRKALARLGEADQLQVELCIERAWPGYGGLAWIGGWFAVSQALEMLQKDWDYGTGPNYLSRRIYQRTCCDVTKTSPRMYAVGILPHLVPQPPIFAEKRFIQLPQYYDEPVRIWVEWIESHKGELMELKPGLDGVDTSPNACKARPRHR